MQKFGIFSPILGQREDFPVILLRNAFTPDNSNVQIWDGEMRSALMRTKELLRSSYQISSLSDNNITISGVHAAEFATNDTVGIYTFVDGQRAEVATASVVSTTESTNTVINIDDISDIAASEGLIGHWRMNDHETDKVVVDSSGNANNGLSQQNTEDVTATGKVGSAISFNGTTDYISVPDGDNWHFDTANFSIGFDFKLTALPITNQIMAFASQYVDNSNRWQFQISGITDSTQHIGFYSVETGTVQANIYTESLSLAADTWYHLLIVRDGNTPYIILNGVSQKIIVYTNFSNLPDLAAPLIIGGYNPSSLSRQLNGCLDDFRIYNKALSAREISLIYNGGSGTENILLSNMFIYNQIGGVIEDLKVPTPDGNPIIKYHFHTAGAEQIEYLLAFTKDHIYRWLSTTQTWFTLWTCSSACTGWSVESYGDKVVATNDIDPPLIWTVSGVFDEMGVDGHGPEVSTGVYISKAKCVTVYNNIILLGHITLSDNTYLPHHVYWGDLGLDNVWKPASDNIAGSMFVNGSGYVVSFGQKQGQLFTFKSDSINRAWFTGTVDVFNQEVYHDRVGCIAPDSIVSDEVSKLYFYGSDCSFREMDDGRISQPIDKTARNLMPDLIGDIRGTYIAEYDEIWWAVPYGNSATANNKVLVYKDGKWLPRDIAVTAFGHWYRNATWTWDTLPFNTWNEWGWDSWDSVSGHKGFAVDICSDADGYTYACHIAHTDMDEAVTSYFVLTTDLADKQALDIYKRLLFIEPYVMNEGSGTLNIQVKRDSEVNWQSAGSISMDGTPEILTQKIPVSYLAKHFLIKMTGTDPFRFIGVILHFETVGDR